MRVGHRRKRVAIRRQATRLAAATRQGRPVRHPRGPWAPTRPGEPLRLNRQDHIHRRLIEVHRVRPDSAVDQDGRGRHLAIDRSGAVEVCRQIIGGGPAGHGVGRRASWRRRAGRRRPGRATTTTAGHGDDHRRKRRERRASRCHRRPPPVMRRFAGGAPSVAPSSAGSLPPPSRTDPEFRSTTTGSVRCPCRRSPGPDR